MESICTAEYTKNDCGLVEFCQKYYFVNLHASADVWFDTNAAEEHHPTEKQWRALEQLLTINAGELEKLLQDLERYRALLLQQKQIVQKAKAVRSIKQQQLKQVVLPKQEETPHTYLLLYADTDWKIRYSGYTIELEILFVNGTFMLVQESQGLWARLEWASEYNVKAE